MEERVMTFREWLEYRVPPADILVATTPEGAGASPIVMDRQLLPIGMAKKHFSNLRIISNHHIERLNTNICSINFNPSSGSVHAKKIGAAKPLRHLFLENLKNNGFSHFDTRHNQYDYSAAYLRQLMSTKFTASPTGYWKESYRSYEAWYCKSIPIVNHDDFLATKYDGLPVLWTWDYSEITEDYLNNEYDKILDQSFDFSKILLSCYDQLKREILQKRMLFRTNLNKWVQLYNDGNPFDPEYDEPKIETWDGL